MDKNWYKKVIQVKLNNATCHAKEVIKSLQLDKLTLEQLKAVSFMLTLAKLSK